MCVRLLLFVVVSCFLQVGSVFAGVVPDDKALQIYKRDIGRIEDYLNGINTLVATFVQRDNEGEELSGMFYMQRPGKIRWEYNPPSTILMIISESLLTYYDTELDQVSHIMVDNSLSDFLARKKIDFSDDSIEVVSFEKNDYEMVIAIRQKEEPDAGQLTLFFNASNSELKKIQVLDAIGKVTDISFNTMVYGKKLGKKLFYLKRPKMRRN